jgi:hypothetical protein
MSHLKYQRLVELAEQPDSPRPAHLLQCESCRLEVEVLSRILHTMRHDRTPDPPEAVVERAYAQFRGRSPVRRAAQGLSRWVASLVQDSGPMLPALAGARGAGPGHRQLLYSSDTLDLDLAHPLGRSPVPLRGQLMPRGDAPEDLAAWRPVTLAVEGTQRPPQLECTDATGDFAFPAVEPGSYRLEIELDDGVLVVPMELPDPSSKAD